MDSPAGVNESGPKIPHLSVTEFFNPTAFNFCFCFEDGSLEIICLHNGITSRYFHLYLTTCIIECRSRLKIKRKVGSVIGI